MSEILGRLLKEGFQAAMMEIWNRDTVLDDFISGKIKIMIAPIHQGHGMGVSNVSHVFIYASPTIMAHEGE
jgi:superfamily II DNA/RNA helicase